MRVAVYHNLPPGGALRALYEFVRRSASEHEYDLYAVDLARFDSFAYAAGRAERHDLTPWVARVHRYPVVPGPLAPALSQSAWTLTALAWMERVQRRIAAEINGRGYDVALVYSCHLTHGPGVLRHLSVPSLYYMNEPRRRSFEAGYQSPEPGAPLVRRTAAEGVERALRRQDLASALAASRVATNSCYSAESIRRAYGRDAAVCYLGVDIETFDLAAGEEPDRRPPSVVSVGALDASKGHDLAVRALALVPPIDRPALDLVYERCDPVYRADLQRLADAGRVTLRLHSGVSDAELARLYRRASAALATARLEPFGLVPLEAAACGTPVVAVREAGYRETVVDAVNGFLVDRSPASLADGICRVLAGGLGHTPAEIRDTVAPRWGWDDAVKRQLEQLALAADRRA